MQEKRGKLRLVGSRDGREGSVTIHQDVDLYATLLGEGEAVTHTLKDGRSAWVQVAQGTATLNGEQLYPGDGVAVGEPGTLSSSVRHRMPRSWSSTWQCDPWGPDPTAGPGPMNALAACSGRIQYDPKVLNGRAA